MVKDWREYRRKNGERIRGNDRRSYHDNPERHIRKRRKHRAKYVRLFKNLLLLMGGRCECCGVTEWWNLELDHLDPVRGSKRRSRTVLVQDLLLGKEPLGKYQILCHGCNTNKGTRERCTIDH